MPILTQRNKIFASGAPLGADSTYNLVDNSMLPLSAPPGISLPDPANPGQFLNYAFLFWNVKGAITPTQTVTIPNVGDDDFSATAWYVPTGGGGNGGPSLTTFAFDIDLDTVLSDTPIQSVTPAGQWAGGNATTVTTTNVAVVVNAKDAMGSKPFVSWTMLGSGTPAGDLLNVPLNGGGWAIAGYKTSRGTIPKPDFELFEDIWATIRDRLKDWVFDPAPIDLLRLFEQQRNRVNESRADDLSDVLNRLDQMTSADLALTQSQLRSRVSRLEAARKMVEEQLRARGGK